MSMVSTTASAHDFEVDGIYYWIHYSYPSKSAVYVTNRDNSSNSYSGVVIIPDSVTYNEKTYIVESIYRNAFSGSKNLTSVDIPNSVTSIGEAAFSGCSGLTSLTIPNSVTSIGETAFSGCSGLTSVTISNSVNTIGLNVFNGCSGLISVTIPNSVTSIGNNAFYSCSGLTSVDIPNSVTSIGSSAFYNCSSLTSVTIPNGVTSINDKTFLECRSLISLVIPNSVTSIGESVFQNCSNLISMTIPDGVTSIGSSAFSNCSSLTSLTIPNSVTAIGEGAFSGCRGLTSLTIPNSVTSIENHVFYGCNGLTSVTIPNSVTSIGIWAFYGCSNLSLVKSEIESPFSFGNKAFSNVSSDCVLEVPIGTKDSYINMGWTTDVFGGGIVESSSIRLKMATSSGDGRTMIGYSSKYGLDFNNVSDVKSYIAVGYTDAKDVILSRAKIVPPYTGIVLTTDNPGVEVEVPISDRGVYYANLLQPAVDNVTIYATMTIDGVDYTNLMVGPDATTGELGFIEFAEYSPVTCSNKCYLRVPTSFYQNATAARPWGGLGIVFDDAEATGIRSLEQDTDTDGLYFDLQGRKVTPAKRGIYIRNGKKILIK